MEKLIKWIFVGFILMGLCGCSVTSYNPATGEIQRIRVFDDSNIQDFLAELPDGTHVEWKSAKSSTSETLRALIEFGIEIGKQMGATP